MGETEAYKCFFKQIYQLKLEEIAFKFSKTRDDSRMCPIIKVHLQQQLFDTFRKVVLVCKSENTDKVSQKLY